jgi:hypothetical protein
VAIPALSYRLRITKRQEGKMQKLPAVKINVKLKNPQSPAYFNQQLEASRNGFNQKQLRSTKINRFLYTTAPDYEPEGREFPAVAGLRAHHFKIEPQ